MDSRVRARSIGSSQGPLERALAREYGDGGAWVALLVPLVLPRLASAQDADFDGIPDERDNCVLAANSDQHDDDQDLYGEGVWYDAHDFFAELARAHPADPALAAHRDRLDRDAVGSSEAPR